MKWIYLSPHLDDAALSCGGLIWQQAQAGQPVEIWTVCAGKPSPQTFSPFAEELHARWKLAPEEAIAARREEDRRAVAVLGAGYRHFAIPDAVYRLHPKTGEHLYPAWEDVVGGLHPGDEAYLRRTAMEMAGLLAGEVTLVTPLAVGNHVDHQFTRALAEMLGLPLRYYADYPYTIEHREELAHMVPPGARPVQYKIPPEGLSAWQESIAAYTSQISTFWESVPEMESAIAQFAQEDGGVILWK